MNKSIMKSMLMLLVAGWGLAGWGETTVFSSASSGAFVLDTTFEEGSEISNRLEIAYGNVGSGACRVEVDGDLLIESADRGTAKWTTLTEGEHTFVWQSADCAMTTTVNVIDLVRLPSPVISPTSGTTFDGASQEVSISGTTEGTKIYYTIDGSDPDTENGREYKGPFNIYDSVTVKAIAVKDDWKDSAVASAAFTKNNGLSAAINMFDCLPDNDLNVPWTIDTTVSHDGVSSARSGQIGDNGATALKATVRGTGRLSFWWKTACEGAWDGEYYDYGVFSVGSTPVAYLAGDSGWRQFVTNITTTGKHVLKWEYCKDDADSVPPDCLWVDQVTWIPADGNGHTLTTPEAVPYSWLVDYGLGLDSDFETAAKGMGANGWSVWQSYVAGLDPTDALSQLTADITMSNDVPYVTWSSNLNTNGEVRVYKVWGKARLDDADEKWTYPTNETHRFFKVSVEMK